MKKSSSIKLALNQNINLDGIIYSVIGIDTYQLKNVLGEAKTWYSYTLIDKENNKTWITYGHAESYFVQWRVITEKEFKQESTKTFMFDFSGIANISFEGNQGYSTPTAEIIWFSVTGRTYDFVAIERFLEQKKDTIDISDSDYLTGTILKNFTI